MREGGTGRDDRYAGQAGIFERLEETGDSKRRGKDKGPAPARCTLVVVVLLLLGLLSLLLVLLMLLPLGFLGRRLCIYL